MPYLYLLLSECIFFCWALQPSLLGLGLMRRKLKKIGKRHSIVPVDTEFGLTKSPLKRFLPLVHRFFIREKIRSTEALLLGNCLHARDTI